MPAKAPLQKLPLLAKKDLRDEWEAKRAEIESTYSKLLKETWKVDVDPLAICAYGDSSSANTPGTVIYRYLSLNIPRLEEFVEKAGDIGLDALNKVAHTHTITIAYDTSGTVNYNSCDISEAGVLRILFNENYYNSYVSDALGNLENAIDAAERLDPSGAPPPPLSFLARVNIAAEYTPHAEEITNKIAKTLEMRDLELDPNFEGICAFMAAQKKGKRRDEYEPTLGRDCLAYFVKFHEKLVELKFGEDDMLREGLAEAMDAPGGRRVIGIRAKQPLVKSSYNEVEIEDGKLWIQSTVDYWASYQGDPANNLLELL